MKISSESLSAAINQGLRYSYGIGMGDFDNDNDYDIVVNQGYWTASTTGYIYIFEKTGAGNSFSQIVDPVGYTKSYRNTDFAVGDLRKAPSGDATCDAVFIFGVLHHIAQWQKALYEVARVLKPGGVLLLDEPKYRFTWEELESGIRNVGLDILDVSSFFFKYIHSYLCQKPQNQSIGETARKGAPHLHR